MTAPTVAIVDLGMGNLYSVGLACAQAGLDSRVTSSPADVEAMDAVILPGIGAFADAMAVLRESGLATALKKAVAVEKPIFGICLGLQLLMTESYEFGHHAGLGIVDGDVVYLEHPRDDTGFLKVPHVGWNEIWQRREWQASPMAGLSDGEFMYFVHSLHVRPRDPGVVIATTRYGNIEFCSALSQGSVFACQFHPERSGPEGLRIYRNFATAVLAPRR